MTNQTQPNAVKVETFIDLEKAAKDVSIVETELNDEFIRQSGHLFYYASMFAKAERQVADIKLRRDLQEAKVATDIRAEAASAGSKTTEGSIKEAVSKHPDVIRYELALNAAREVESTLKGLVEAFKHKKDMLVVRGNISRDEFKASIALTDGSSLRDRDAATKARMAA